MQDGAVVADRFEVLCLATTGGMGSVYKARDRLTGEFVALKVVLQRGLVEVGRFLREGKALAALRHPAIVRYVAHGVSPQGDAYLAMEWLDGHDLGERLARGGLSVRESVAVVRRAAEALAFAHARGLIHRDVKPSNLFLVDGDVERLKILDFGIVRHAVSTTEGLTRTGAIVGTPGYMAPEQVRGNKDIDSRVDVFALGCVLYRCLTGRAPFASDDPIAILTRVLFEEVAPARTIARETPPLLDDLVSRLLSKDRAARPADAGALLALLADIELPESGSVPGATTRLEAITAREQKLLSIVLAGASRSVLVQCDATLTSDTRSMMVARIRARIEDLGGRLEALANDSFVVVCGGQGTPREQAIQAARCALAVREHLPDAPIAVATGRTDPAAPLPVGEVVERAARLLRMAGEAIDLEAPTLVDDPSDATPSRAPASTVTRLVRIDAVTAALLGPRFEVTGEDDARVLRGERPAGEPVLTLLGRETPCFGRERELALLLGAYDECAAEPVATAVVVTGPVGVGKSRLRLEFVRRVQRAGSPGQVWFGSGDPMRAGAPFALLAQALAATMDLAPEDALSVRRAKVVARVGRSVAPPDARRVAEFLGELVDSPFPAEVSVQLRAARREPMLMGDQIRLAWEDFVAAECALGPLLLVLEDLHWGDLPTIRLVDAALRRHADRPLMVLAVARPEIEELFPRLFSERHVQPLPLGELTARASERLVRHVLGGEAPAAHVQAILERADGNPFYIEELLRAVSEGRAGAMPESVLAMTQARLDGLDAAARRVLRAASVFGRSFRPRAVMALLGVTEDGATEVRSWLQVLVDREILCRSADGLSAPEDELAFRNALFREASYAMLTDKDRAVGHRLAAEWLEAHGETEALVLASHLELGGEDARAVSWYLRAAEQGLEGNDFAAVIARAGRGIARGAAGEALGVLRTLQLEAHFWRGESEEVARRGAEALLHLAPGSAPHQRTLARLLVTSSRRGDVGRVTELAGFLVGALEGGGVAREAEGACVFALAQAATQLLFLGLYDLVPPLVTRADRIARAEPGRDDPALAGWADDARSCVAMLEGDLAACVLLNTSASRHFVAAGDLRHACVEDGYVGYGYMELGMFEEAERALRECLGRAERLALPHVIATAQHNLGFTCAMLGRPVEARALLDAAIATFAALGDRRLEGAAHRYLATLLLGARDLNGAEVEARTAMSLAVSAPAMAATRAVLASVLMAHGRPADALVYAAEAHGTLDELGSIDTDDIAVRRAYAEALYLTGDAPRAKRVVSLARERLQQRARRISNEEWQRSLLERVPDNARIFTLAKEWGLTPRP